METKKVIIQCGLCVAQGILVAVTPITTRLGERVVELTEAISVAPTSMEVVSAAPAFERALSDAYHRDDSTAPLRLYLAKHSRGQWIKYNQHPTSGLHPTSINLDELMELEPFWRLDDVAYFGSEFEPMRGHLHIIVSVKVDSQEEEEAKGERITTQEENMDLSKLWNNSTLNSLPSEVEALRSTLQRRLPRRVHLMDNRNDSAIFTEGCPEIRCDGLSTLINGYLMTCKAGSGMCNTSESLWQHFYDKLIDITVHICLSRGMRVNIMRNVEDPTGTSKKKKRPDVIIICNDMVVLRGEEKRAGVDIDIPSLELTTKMNPWSIMRYGQLPFILGYVTSGPRLQIVMINATNGELKVTEVLDINSIHMWNKSDAIKAFYNLAFIFEQMVVASRQALPTRWLPCRNRNRRLELVKISVGKPFTEPREIEVIQRTIKRKWYVGDDYKRLAKIYRVLQKIEGDSDETHLQKVGNLDGAVFHAFGTKIVAQLTPLGYHRQPDTEAEVYNWLHDMLTALRNWHACGYCHGDVCMENIVYIPSSTRGYWILIDMDKSHPPGARITWNHPNHGGTISKQYDLSSSFCSMK